MKFKYLAVIGITALLMVGCAKEVTSNPTDTQSPATNVTTEKTVSTAQVGTFQAGEHPTQGKARVFTESGKRYLEFDQAFKTNSGPDLFVILHRNNTVPVSGIKEKDYVSIATLQKTSGNQRYTLPDNVNLADYKSVAIWCRQFNATFGYAPLQ